VAFLSSFLTEQNRKTRRQLAAMENHVKRVEKMATVGEMAAGLAHEIKNPLAALKGSIQLLREEADYDPIRDRLMQIIVREADRLSSLVSSFLLFARPPMGRAEKIDLRQAMMETVELFEKDSSAWERITVEKSIPSELWIEMDPQHLRQVLWNLLVNAGEAIEGSGRIIVDVSHERNRRIQIRITDNGCGMQPDDIKSIFDPFFTTKPTGTGLGLSIVHRILETYDSFLDVESRPGMGSTFTLNLRQAESPAS
jgi:two-component system sensor histidine kinase PilS (NtrC family)